MTKRLILTSVLAISGAMFLGCDRNDSASSGSGTGTNTSVEGVTKSAGDAAKQAGEAAKQAGEAAQQAGADAAKAGEKAASDMAATARGLIEKVENHIKENKYTEAKTLLEQLEKMRTHLPQDLQDKIAALSKLVSEKVGSLPNMGK